MEACNPGQPHFKFKLQVPTRKSLAKAGACLQEVSGFEARVWVSCGEDVTVGKHVQIRKTTGRWAGSAEESDFHTNPLLAANGI